MSAHDYNYVLVAEKRDTVCYYYARTAKGARTEALWLQRHNWSVSILDINSTAMEYMPCLLPIQPPILHDDIRIAHDAPGHGNFGSRIDTLGQP